MTSFGTSRILILKIMKVAITLCTLFISAYCIPMFDEELNNAWSLFKRVHKKQYASIEEEMTRYTKKSFDLFMFFCIIAELIGKLIYRKFVNIILKLI